ncbi:LOW QUALITY PROTEIN: hypothetical protein U9M48_000974, partial [Paspalum notatum var. saurae]
MSSVLSSSSSPSLSNITSSKSFRRASPAAWLCFLRSICSSMMAYILLTSLAILRRTPWRSAAANAGKKSDTLGPAASTDASSTMSLTSRAVPESRSAESMVRDRRPSAAACAAPPMSTDSPRAAWSDTRRTRPATASCRWNHVAASRCGEKSSAAPSRRSARHLRRGGRQSTERSQWPQARMESPMDRAAMSALCRWRISRAVSGEEATMDGAEAERHERAVTRGEAREGAVRQVVQLVEVADQRERPWAWWKAVTRIVEELEGIGGKDER